MYSQKVAGGQKVGWLGGSQPKGFSDRNPFAI